MCSLHVARYFVVFNQKQRKVAKAVIMIMNGVGVAFAEKVALKVVKPLVAVY